ncbi:MAG: ATP-binding protein [Chthoniobacteraceae bacterium]
MARHPSLNPDAVIHHDRELNALRERLEEVKAGRGGVTLITGPAGIGKSVLIDAVLRESGCTASRGHNFHHSTQSLACLRTAMVSAVQELGLTRRDVTGPARTALVMLFAEVGGREARETKEATIASLGALLGAMAERAEHGLVLVLEDLHAADSLTLEAIPELLAGLEKQRVWIIGTYRDDHVPPRLRWMRNELRRMRAFHEIALPHFDREATCELLERIGGRTPSPTVVDQVLTRTGGVPFYIHELALSMADAPEDGIAAELPESLRDAVLADVVRLSAEARRFIEWAAVAGTEFDVPLIRELSGAAAGADECFERKLFRETDGQRAHFRHHLTQEAIRDGLERGERRAIHTRLAARLEADGASPERIAEHWVGAGETQRACACLLRAAEKACANFAYWDATEWIRRAFQVCPDAAVRAEIGLLERYAECAQLSGQLQEAASTWQRIAGVLKEEGTPERYANSQRALATIFELQGRLRESIQCRIAAQEVFTRLESWADAAVEALSCSAAHLGALQTALAENKAREALALAKQAKDGDLTLRTEGILGLVLSVRGKTNEAGAILQKSLQVALRGQKADIAAELYRWLGAVQEYRSDFKGAAAFYESVVDGCRASGAKAAAYECMGCLSWVMFRTGDWNRAAAICRDVLSSKYSPDVSRAVAEGVLATIQTLRGETRSARRHGLRCLDLAEHLGMAAIVMIGRWGLALLEEADGNAAEAGAVYRELLALWENSEDRHDAIAPLSHAAEFFCATGEEADAGRCVAALQMIVKETGNGEAIGALALAMGEMALANGDHAGAMVQFRQAVQHWEELEVPFELARAEWRAGTAAALAGDVATSEQFLHRSLQRFRRLGARTQAARMAAQLGERNEEVAPAREPKAKPVSTINLTPRQRDVARLVSEGLTYKEIAAKLFLSPRTVEMHAASLLDRTNSRSRSEVVRKLQELELL